MNADRWMLVWRLIVAMWISMLVAITGLHDRRISALESRMEVLSDSVSTITRYNRALTQDEIRKAMKTDTSKVYGVRWMHASDPDAGVEFDFGGAR